MKISVIGCGYLGAVHAAAMASVGHDVIGVDLDSAKINALSAGRSPIYEPGLPELLTAGIETGRLKFSTDLADARDAHIHFIAVGTPQLQNAGGADLAYVDSAITSLLAHLSDGDVVVGKSTVPVGTAETFREAVEARGARLVWNPEFLREGFAVKDTIEPDRLVYGVADGDTTSVEKLNEVYATAIEAGSPVIVSDFATAELVKVAANAFLATKISFINAMAEIAEVTGADVTKLADAIGHDKRIGRKFLNAGVGFGGGCLPKDIRAFTARAEELGRGESVAFLKEVDAINLRRRERVVELVTEELGGSVFQKKVAVLGLAFKPNSDDVRDSPALDVAVRLNGLGANVVATDPQAMKNARQLHPQLVYGPTDEALADADAVVVVTEWPEYKDLDPAAVHRVVRTPIVVDARNCLDADSWAAAGWEYAGLGRQVKNGREAT
ncbi:UDP-glucose dehydrogenase family protein [Paramicrobacterium sp. CJ85]|uniref:UDP-glucose dehydrogenase family protein n=1 Tax=Paramicrobacterium sp. CJ85 TaxID=3445355 RepID=UPI003F6433D3